MRRNNYVFDRVRSNSYEFGETSNYLGVASKSGILLFVTFLSACLTIVFLNSLSNAAILFYVLASLATVVLHIIISFKPHLAKGLSIPYVICEGFVIGILCDLLKYAFPGEGLSLAAMALMMTFGILIAAVILYSNHRIRVSTGFLKVFCIILLGILIANILFSIISLILYLSSGINLWMIYFYSPLSIFVSIIMVLISAIYVYMTIQNVSDLVENGADKKYEWYMAFGVVMSIIWLFLDILRLLIRLAASRSRD